MQKSEKERVVAELAERLNAAQALIVADYRGLTNSELESLRDQLTAHGARFTVVKNTLTRRAAEAAGADSVLALLEGPTAIAFIESEGDPVAVAKALAQTARDTRILAIRGGVLEGRSMSVEDVESLAKLPALDVLRGQVLGAMTGPLYAIVGLLTAPLQNLHGFIDARIAQLEAEGDTSGQAEGAREQPETAAAAEADDAEAAAETDDAEAAAGSDASPEPEVGAAEATSEREPPADATETRPDATAEAADEPSSVDATEPAEAGAEAQADPDD